MKKLSLALFVFFVFQGIGFSQELDQSIYESLKVNEIDISQGEGAEIFKKEISGIFCTKTTIIYPQAVPRYGCVFKTQELQSKELYESLNLEEVQENEGRVGAEIFVKKMKDLVCKKTVPVVLNPTPQYQCQINLIF
jgi:hypothetical protein